MEMRPEVALFIHMNLWQSTQEMARESTQEESDPLFDKVSFVFGLSDCVKKLSSSLSSVSVLSIRSTTQLLLLRDQNRFIVFFMCNSPIKQASRASGATFSDHTLGQFCLYQ